MRDILRISVPLTVWLAAFSAVYGLEGIVCSPSWETTDLSLAEGRTALMLAAAAAVALQVALLLALRAPRFASPSPFMKRLSLMLAAASLVATVWTLFPVAVTAVCL
ncbi:hypothetical protein GI374_13130 [Paracoccus sp. S-4012]|uniref:hypothetical protein n=1 Tax=Paracoccus sp. S-4012 TaxID=2665648 RepID=UPI0012AFE2F7|nr:hypothetical protein [Paracoccus sp. S-4012]MRX51367.1 hypothetical protein [Paracoccus sp. S-4012]